MYAGDVNNLYHPDTVWVPRNPGLYKNERCYDI